MLGELIRQKVVQRPGSITQHFSYSMGYCWHRCVCCGYFQVYCAVLVHHETWTGCLAEQQLGGAASLFPCKAAALVPAVLCPPYLQGTKVATRPPGPCFTVASEPRAGTGLGRAALRSSLLLSAHPFLYKNQASAGIKAPELSSSVPNCVRKASLGRCPAAVVSSHSHPTRLIIGFLCHSTSFPCATKFFFQPSLLLSPSRSELPNHHPIPSDFVGCSPFFFLLLSLVIR
jgi:hypothetical protein